jgi:flagellar hook-associated protein 1 FlgK
VREQTSGVSLDEEATRLIQFQRGYQACAQLLSVLSSLTGTVINMLQPG